MPVPRPLRRLAWWAAVALALLWHGLLVDRLGGTVLSPTLQDSPLQRFEAVYARQVQLAPADPGLRAVPSRTPTARPRRALAMAAVASAPAPAPAPAESAPAVIAASAPPTEAAPVADALPAPASAAEGPDQAAASASASVSASASAAASATGVATSASAPAFEWPASTRIRYRLAGFYRGEVHGQAEVEWLRDGDRYQVHLEVSAALLFVRRMSSEGRITADGLVPQRYEEVTTNRLKLFSEPRRVAVRFDPDTITLADGSVVAREAGVQDSASQFIQFIYLLATRPGLREPGQPVDVALALPRRVGHWSYQTGPTEVVETPAGPVETVPVHAGAGARPGELQAHIWFAPRLQMLPVRIRMLQTQDVYFDLFIDRLPDQAVR